jgi:AcrR family transcriptional regulator
MAGEGRSDTGDPAALPRRRGRPRSDGVERAILAAGARLLAQHGVKHMSMEAVAVAAHVSKATIYRRWPSKDALVHDLIGMAAGRRFEDVRVGSGDVRDDLVQWVRRGLEEERGPLGAALQHLVRRAVEDPSLAASLRRQELRRRRESFARIVEEGIRSGQLRQDLDPDLLLDMVSGPVVYRRLLEPATGPPLDPAGQAHAIVDIVWPGIDARP